MGIPRNFGDSDGIDGNHGDGDSMEVDGVEAMVADVKSNGVSGDCSYSISTVLIPVQSCTVRVKNF